MVVLALIFNHKIILVMKNLNFEEMEATRGGSKTSAITGGIACALAAGSWLIPGGGVAGTLIFGPTCAGMIGYTIWD